MTKARRYLPAISLLFLSLASPLPSARVSASPAPSLDPLPPALPIEESDWRTITKIVPTTSARPWIEYITDRTPDSEITLRVPQTKRVDSAFFLFDELADSASTPAEIARYKRKVGTTRTAIANAVNTALKDTLASAPDFKVKVGIFGSADQRCDVRNYDGTRSKAKPPIKNTYDLKDDYSGDFCRPLTRDQWADLGNGKWGPNGSTTTLMTGATEEGRVRHITYAGAWLSWQRAYKLQVSLRNSFNTSSDAVTWASTLQGDSVPSNVFVHGMGEWNATASVNECDGIAPTQQERTAGLLKCALDRRAEVVTLIEWSVLVVDRIPGEETTSTVPHPGVTDTSVVTSRVNCSFYNTCLPALPAVTASPVINVPPFMQPNKTFSFTLDATQFSCAACTTPRSSGSPASGWGVPALTSATFSGPSLTPPPGYSSPAYWESKSRPTSSSPMQKLSIMFKKATRAGEAYKINPGTVTYTFTFTPWLWDGSTLTWVSSKARTISQTVPVECRYAPTSSTSCSFKVLGTALAN